MSRLLAYAYLVLGMASAIGARTADAQRLEIRVEVDSGQTSQLRLALPKGDTIAFQASVLLSRDDFSRLVVQPEGRSTYAVVGTLNAPSLERLVRQNDAFVGRRIGVIVGGKLVAVWRVQSALTSRIMPLATGVSEEIAKQIAASTSG